MRHNILILYLKLENIIIIIIIKLTNLWFFESWRLHLKSFFIVKNLMNHWFLSFKNVFM